MAASASSAAARSLWPASQKAVAASLHFFSSRAITLRTSSSVSSRDCLPETSSFVTAVSAIRTVASRTSSLALNAVVRSSWSCCFTVMDPSSRTIPRCHTVYHALSRFDFLSQPPPSAQRAWRMRSGRRTSSDCAGSTSRCLSPGRRRSGSCTSPTCTSRPASGTRWLGSQSCHPPTRPGRRHRRQPCPRAGRTHGPRGAATRSWTVPGVFVMGSNDYYAPILKNPFHYFKPQPTQEVSANRYRGRTFATGSSAAGWGDLEQQRVTRKVGDRVIEFVGTDDAHCSCDRYDEVQGAPDPSADLTLGVTHAPYLRVVDRMAADEIPLVFAGPYPRRPGLSARRRCAGHQLRPARETGEGSAPARRSAGCTSRLVWAPLRTRRSGSPARPRRRCSRSSAT